MLLHPFPVLHKPAGRIGSWRLALTPLNTIYIVERCEYPYLDCPGDPPRVVSDPAPIRESEFVHRIPSPYDGLMIEALVQNRW